MHTFRPFGWACAAAVLLTLLPTAPARAQNTSSQPSEAILRLLQQQAADWNRGDLDAFATGYKNSPDILFIGSSVRHGYDGMLAGYRAAYPNRAAMGTLTFSKLAVQPLGGGGALHFATATGHYHLQRSAAAGGIADGFFFLVLENTRAGWKVVRDDTTATPAQNNCPPKP